MEKLPSCEKGKKCECFFVRNFVAELGGLGNEESLKKIRSVEEYENCNQKNRKLGRFVRELEAKVDKGVREKGIFICANPDQIIIGRRKYQACLKELKKISRERQIKKTVVRQKEKKFSEVAYEEGIETQRTF